VGLAPRGVADAISKEFGWDNDGAWCHDASVDLMALRASQLENGTPVVGLVSWMRGRVAPEVGPWIHRGGTSQDIVDTALMLLGSRTAQDISARLREVEARLIAFVQRERDVPAISRTLTQHAVPTTVGARAVNWVRAVRRARVRLDEARANAPAQLGGAAGTLASIVAIAREEGAADPAQSAIALGEHFSRELNLAHVESPWHTFRAPVTELGDAFVQAVDGLAHIAADLSLLGRPEIGEVLTSGTGASSAMPHKRNPVHVVLVKSAGVRAPFLGATLHAAAATAHDERSDGAWQAELPVFVELAGLAHACAESSVAMVTDLRVNPERVAANLHSAGGAAMSERVSIVLAPNLTPESLRAVLDAVSAGATASELQARFPELAGLDIAGLLDPSQYTGLAAEFVDRAVTDEHSL